MTSPKTLRQCFLAQLSQPGRVLLSPSSLEALLSSIVSSASAAWPTLILAPEQLITHLARHVDSADDPLGLLQRLKVEDLYLACACASRDERALALFERLYGPVIEEALLRQGFNTTQVEEVKQILRRDLFVGQGQAPPLITSYAGRGRLRGWIQITAVRAALKLIRKDRNVRPLEDQAMQALPSLSDDPELSYMKSVYRAAFKEAFRESLAALPSRELNLLRQHFVDGLSTVQLGALYRVNQSTASRWLSKAQQDLLDRTKEALVARLKLKPAEYDTIIKLVASQMDLTLRTFLGKKPPG